MRRWKLSDTGVVSITVWEDRSRTKDGMFEATDHPDAPWWTAESDDKRAAELNTIRHLLSPVPAERREPEKVTIPPRPSANNSDRPIKDPFKRVRNHAAEVRKK